ncbi:MAG TPA: hypothetical protein VFT91_11830, partial [Dehalococcoidia bacterium]|nr:hypothetical protein [Dehalococcoidia bacterium]
LKAAFDFLESAKRYVAGQVSRDMLRKLFDRQGIQSGTLKEAEKWLSKQYPAPGMFDLIRAFVVAISTIVETEIQAALNEVWAALPTGGSDTESSLDAAFEAAQKIRYAEEVLDRHIVRV